MKKPTQYVLAGAAVIVLVGVVIFYNQIMTYLSSLKTKSTATPVTSTTQPPASSINLPSTSTTLTGSALANLPTTKTSSLTQAQINQIAQLTTAADIILPTGEYYPSDLYAY